MLFRSTSVPLRDWCGVCSRSSQCTQQRLAMRCLAKCLDIPHKAFSGLVPNNGRHATTTEPDTRPAAGRDTSRPVHDSADRHVHKLKYPLHTQSSTVKRAECVQSATQQCAAGQAVAVARTMWLVVASNLGQAVCRVHGDTDSQREGEIPTCAARTMCWNKLR